MNTEYQILTYKPIARIQTMEEKVLGIPEYTFEDRIMGRPKHLTLQEEIMRIKTKTF